MRIDMEQKVKTETEEHKCVGKEMTQRRKDGHKVGRI